MVNVQFAPGDQVREAKLGMGQVEFDKGSTVIVRFSHGIEECEKSRLEKLWTPLQVLSQPQWHTPLEVIVKAQAETIEALNDAWGVFSRSRIDLLPHQLWVCRRVLETWPTRWLVADDVGLGKTIEAGILLWPLLSKGLAKRLLILAPASLVPQWQYRLRTMFDIRTMQYTTEIDTEKSDFWGTQHQVVASIQTLRQDWKGRHQRLLESDPWDLVIVDEAHHLNADEDRGPTLGYRLVEKMVEENRVKSMVFFTGTPHRGKNFGFLSLMQLLRPDLFDPKKDFGAQLTHLPEVMIRNNKQNVTDLKGNRLFKPPIVSSETYTYSEAETRFYNMLTEFITTGKTYASSLDSTNSRAVMLVLITMQKLASSSVAAIRRALKRRLARVIEVRKKLQSLQTELDKKAEESFREYNVLENNGDSGDEVAALEEQIVELSAALLLMEDEEPRLRELISAAEEVVVETKIKTLVSIVEDRFADQSILFFTEYKATQSLLMSALMQRFGDQIVGFINGDERAEEVVDQTGQIKTINENRESTAERFNAGQLRFLISTEAGGEGIDLQEQCSTLIHVDLPWNPMRLHQRVGRINRYGQKNQVEVMTLRNPDTVESRIWDKLNTKIDHIMMALRQVMDEPEDLFQLVLGMTPNSMFREVFAEGSRVSPEGFSDWFDEKTAQFGGRDVIDTVRDLVGSCSQFDFQAVSKQLPHVDLPALRPFIVSSLVLNSRRIKEEEEGLSFLTPEVWRSEPGIRSAYERMIFDRSNRSKGAAQRILGVGHKVVDQALKQAKGLEACVATLPVKILKEPLVIFQVKDRVTTEGRTVRHIVVGVQVDKGVQEPKGLLRDWQLLEVLNELSEESGMRRNKDISPAAQYVEIQESIKSAQRYVEEKLPSLDAPFAVPQSNVLAVLW